MQDHRIKLLIGLGNPGKRYDLTRHNAGWLWLDAHFGSDGYEYNKYGNYDFKIIEFDEGKYVLVKPQTFMNNSGQAAEYATKQFGIDIHSLVIVHDEVDLQIGDYKYSCGRGDGGHNGIKSITKAFGTNEYCRLRLGVRPSEVPPSIKADTYVLNRFRDAELKLLTEVPMAVIK